MKKKYGIIGNPIKHSLSPVLHNYWFRKYEIDSNYSIIDVKESEISSIIKKLKNEDLSGINVTLPYKQKIVPHLSRLVNDALITSSVNTVYLDDKKALIGENTDVFGLQAAYLKEVDNSSKKKDFSNRSRWSFTISNSCFTKIGRERYLHNKSN